MRKNSKNEKVIRAMAIGISAMLMASSPLTALAAEGEGTTPEGNEDKNITVTPEAGIADQAQAAAKEADKAVETAEKSATDVKSEVADQVVAGEAKDTQGKDLSQAVLDANVKVEDKTVEGGSSLKDAESAVESADTKLGVAEANDKLSDAELNKATDAAANAGQTAAEAKDAMQAAQNKVNGQIENIKDAASITDANAAYEEVKTTVDQAQADFEYKIFHEGADGTAFPTIAGSGANGTMLHYDTNRDVCEDETLLLMDLGAKFQGYCADITRTYPVNGKYTDRQRQVYDVVLAANRAVAKAAKPGMTLKELDDIAKDVLGEGCVKLGLIEKKEDVGTYYMHGVSHHLGIDVHDVTAAWNDKLRPGAIITDEPGLYIDEWEIGIRIEDDILITEDGCEVLSENLMRDPDQIEAFMQEKEA